MIFAGAGLLIFAVLSLFGQARQMHSFGALRLVFLTYASLIVILAVLMRKGWWHSSLRFVNTALQIT
ncbi:MAG: hypothetical protein WC076_10130, partial [Terrimicrobiaceae bacterium]